MPNADMSTSGFTLLEVIVALTIGAMIVGVAHALVVTLGDGATAIADARVRADRESNSERMLRGLVSRAEAGSVEAPFEGLPNRVRFRSWCCTPNGWLEACDVHLQLTADRAGNRLEALLIERGTSRSVVLARGFQTGAIRYLSDVRLGGRWMTVWGAGTSVPIALGVVIDGDTTVLRIGNRG